MELPLCLMCHPMKWSFAQTHPEGTKAVDSWKFFMKTFVVFFFNGPFSLLLLVTTQLGWVVNPEI